MPKRNTKGFIDPISIIGVLMLVITLVVGTKVTNDRSMSLNISEKASDCFNECRQESGRERCNERCGVNVNWKGEIVDEIDTSNVPKDYEGKTCDANGTQHTEGSKVIGGSGSGYSKCEGGRWVDCPECTVTSLTTVPVYKEEEYKNAVEAEKKAAEQLATEQQTVEKSQCLQDGGSWLNNTCSYAQQKEAIATFVPIIEKQECEAQGKVLVNGECISAQTFIDVERDETGTTRDLVTIYRDDQNNVVGSNVVPNITIQNTQTVEKDAAPNGRSSTTYNTIIRDGNNNIITYNSIPTYTESFKNVEKVDDGFIRDFTTVLRNQNTNEILNAITQSVNTKDLAQVAEPTTNTHNFADCNREGLTPDQTSECNRKLSQVYNAPIIGRYLQAYSPEKVKTYWEIHYNSREECLADFSGKAKGYCDQVQYTKEQLASSVSLGVAGTAVGALITASGGAATGAITGYQAIAFAMATSTMYQTGSAVDICVTAPNSPECDNAKLWAAVSWVNVGSSGLANAYQASKLAQGINTAVNIANVGADALDISQSCGDGQFASKFGCVAAWGGLVVDVGQGGVDIARVINNNISGLSGNLGSLPDVNSNIVPDTNRFFATNAEELALLAKANLPDVPKANIPMAEIPAAKPVDTPSVPKKTFTELFDEKITNPIINSPVGDFLFGKPTISLDNLDTPLPPAIKGNAPDMIKPVETQAVEIPYSKELDPLIEVKNAWNKYGDRLTTAYNNKDAQGLIDIAKENGYQVKIVPFGEKVDIVEIGGKTGKTTKMPMTKADTVSIGKDGGKKTLFIATSDILNPTYNIPDLAHDIGAVITDIKFIPVEKIYISPYSFADFMTKATGESWKASDIAKNFHTLLNERTGSVEVPITYIADALTFGKVPSNFLESVPPPPLTGFAKFQEQLQQIKNRIIGEPVAPPITPGEVFDPNIEIKNILKSPNRTEALADFKTKLAYQQKGIAKIQTELEKTILNNSTVTFDELTNQVNSLSKTYGLSNTQMGKLEDALTIYQERTTRISELLSDYPDKNDLFEAMFGKKPVGRIEISRGPISIHIKAYNPEDYGYMHNRDLTNPAIPTNTNSANTSGGFFKPSGTLLPDTEGLIIVENNTKWYYKFFAPDVVGIHEDQHALNNLLEQADIYPASLSGYSDSYYNLQEALVLGDNKLINTSLQNYLDRVKTSANYNVKDEMLAMLKDGSPNSTITKDITQPKNNGGIYDFYGRRKEDVIKVFNSEDLAANKSIQEIIDQNLGTNASKTVINNGLKAFDNLLSKGYTRNEALAVLEKTLLPNWLKVAERTPAPNFVTRTVGYITQKTITPLNMAILKTPSSYFIMGGIIGEIAYVYTTIDKIQSEDFDWNNTYIGNWWKNLSPLFSAPEITIKEQVQLDNQQKDTQDLKTNVNTVVTTTVAVQPQAENNIQLESIKNGLYAQTDPDIASTLIPGGAGKPFKNIGCGQTTVANILCEYSSTCPTPIEVANMIPLNEYDGGGLTPTQSNIKILNKYGFTTDPYRKSLEFHLTEYMEPNDILWISANVGGISHHTYLDGYSIDSNGTAIYNLNDSYFGDGFKCITTSDSSFGCTNNDGKQINIAVENANIYIIDTN